MLDKFICKEILLYLNDFQWKIMQMSAQNVDGITNIHIRKIDQMIWA